MALINCAECNHQVSESAKACPSCGAPLNLASSLPRLDASRVAKYMPSSRNLAFAGIVGSVLVFGAGWLFAISAGTKIGHFISSVSVDAIEVNQILAAISKAENVSVASFLLLALALFVLVPSKWEQSASSKPRPAAILQMLLIVMLVASQAASLYVFVGYRKAADEDVTAALAASNDLNDARRSEASADYNASDAEKLRSASNDASFVKTRRFDEVDGMGVYEAVDSGYTKCVLIAPDAKTESMPGTFFTLRVQSLGNKKFTVTRSNAYQHYDTDQYYPTYRYIELPDGYEARATAEAARDKRDKADLAFRRAIETLKRDRDPFTFSLRLVGLANQ